MVIIDCHKDTTATYLRVRYQIFLLLYRSLTLTTMKPYFWLLALCLSGLVAAQSRVLDAASLPSKILKSERNYAVYLPDGYEQSSRSYPVLYLLHGYTDNQTGWVQFGEVQHIADKAIAAGEATPMIIMPDADTGRPGYTNGIDDKWAYEDFFFNELTPHLENTYRIRDGGHTWTYWRTALPTVLEFITESFHQK